ncbi:MAG: UDP-N-acetylmuramate dehydrogenase [Candidatus Kinetoplastibacterium crithidii]|nr:MAG: UDP-N-acetylmuramate dehydrogenase [Candidatus Kinetoplastibacterium crithidii]
MKKPCYKNLKKLNTFGIDIYTKNFFCVSNYDDLKYLIEIRKNYSKMFVIGGGSNVILSPNIVDALVVKIGILGIKILSNDNNHILIDVGAGESWHDIVVFCLSQGWYGLENLALIPGTVGGAPVQNIGAYGLEFSEYCHSVFAWSFKSSCFIEIKAQDCLFSYRESIFKKNCNDYLILSVRLCLDKIWTPRIEYHDIRNQIANCVEKNVTPEYIFDIVCSIRRRKLPSVTVLGNVGSFFKNPILELSELEYLKLLFPNIVFWNYIPGVSCKISAGWLINICGWKGRVIGPVAVYKKQSLILVNINNANANDVLVLAHAIQEDVRRKTGISLEIEPVVF